MNRRINLLEEALLKSRAAFERAPNMFPLASVIAQIQYLLDGESGGAVDESRLATVSIGQIAARDIDTFDGSLAELLYEVSAEARVLLSEAR